MSSAPAVAAGRGRLPVQNRDRRAALTALALLLVVAGALGAALVVYRTGHRVDVLVAAHEIKPGERVSSSDFETTRVAADSGNVVKAADRNNFVGTYATTDIPTGTLVNRLMFQAGNVLPSDGVLVGVSLTQSQRPASSIATGDVVRAYLLVKASNTDTPVPGPVLIDAARVVNVTSAASSGNSITISLLVDPTAAQSLVTAAAQGAVAVAELPKSTKPAVDFQTKS
jgi:hypothetical protein